MTKKNPPDGGDGDDEREEEEDRWHDMVARELMKMATFGGEAQATEAQINVTLQEDEPPTRAMETLQDEDLRVRMEIRKQQ